MKKLVSLMLVLCLLTCLTVVATADKQLVVDDANLLTADQRNTLEDLAEKMSDAYGMDIVIYTCDKMSTSDPEKFADDYYDNNGYGQGSDKSGILFMISMAERDWAISTAGNGIYALTDYGQESVFSSMSSYLSSGNYYEAFYTYLENLEDYLIAYKNGAPIDGYVTEYTGEGSFQTGTAEYTQYYPTEQKRTIGDYITRILVSLGIGSAAGGITVSSMKRGMKTDVAQKNANTYMKGQVHFTGNFDMLVGSHTVRTPRQTERSSGGGHSGGGSSVHHSSGGVSHGGSHGKF